MRLLVTGGSGFLGEYVLTEGARRGHETVALARSAAAALTVARRGGHSLTGDLDDPAGLLGVFGTAHWEALVNLASLGFGHAPAIVAATRAAAIERAVFVSTRAVQTTLPAHSKRVRLDAEHQIRDSGLKWTILRPTMIYGAPGGCCRSLPPPGTGSTDIRGRSASSRARFRSPLSLTELLRSCVREAGSRTRLVPVPPGGLGRLEL